MLRWWGTEEIFKDAVRPTPPTLTYGNSYLPTQTISGDRVSQHKCARINVWGWRYTTVYHIFSVLTFVELLCIPLLFGIIRRALVVLGTPEGRYWELDKKRGWLLMSSCSFGFFSCGITVAGNTSSKNKSANGLMCEVNTNMTSHRATHIFKAAHEVVADRRSRQVCGVGAPANVKEVIRTQHGVVFLGITGGGQNTIYWDGHLVKASVKREEEKNGSREVEK